MNGISWLKWEDDTLIACISSAKTLEEGIAHAAQTLVTRTYKACSARYYRLIKAGATMPIVKTKDNTSLVRRIIHYFRMLS